jgi:7-cyano-7-deazaguanine synthase in queuosine biosynthesis
MKHILLWGGGVDSACYLMQLQQAGQPVELLHIDYGQHAALGERDRAYWWAHQYGTVLHTRATDLLMGYANPNALMGTHSDLYIDGRNLGFVILACEYGDVIHLGSRPGAYPDCSPRFTDVVNELFSLVFVARPRILRTDLVAIDRVSLLRRCLLQEPELLARTWTCYQSMTLTECGTCTHCQRKQRLIAEVNGV